jgi:molybdopterin synthase sulfur carrier subunit
LLYFGRPKERLGVTKEIINAPEAASTLASLLAWLALRGADWAHELTDQPVRCAVNQTFAEGATVLNAGDEVAIFSPISGG